jgi:hypothetical protein
VNRKQARQAIRQLIILHQDVLLAGGISPLSDPYTQFIAQKKAVLRTFALPETNENLFIMFDFPLSRAYDYPFPMWEKICFFRRETLVRSYYYNLQRGIPWAKNANNLWNLEERVEWCYGNLVTRAIEHLSE